MVMAHGTDIFLSYKSEQHTWAARLQGDLERYGYTVFVDHDTAAGLKAGETWEAQLANQIQQAEHFFVLWSSLITVDSYVLKEIDIRKESGRPVTLLPLDDSRPPQSLPQTAHQFRELIELHQQDDDAHAVDFFKWNRAVRHLVEQLLIEGSSRVVEIPVVVVAMTNSQATEIRTGSQVVSRVKGEKNDAFTRLWDLLNKTAPFDPDRYGSRPEDWRPFDPALDPSDVTVEQVIRDFDDKQREWNREHPADEDGGLKPYVFLPYGEALRSESTSNRARQRLQEGPALVIVDPLSLVHEEVYAEVIGNGLHTLNRAFVIGLGPHISSSLEPVRTYFDVEKALFNGLLMADPHERSRSIFGPMLSTCVLNVTHSFELSRWVQVASESILSWAERSSLRMHPAYDQHVRRSGPATLPSMYSPGRGR
jgi:hypothetical protein